MLMAAGVAFFLFARDNQNLFHFMAGPRVNEGRAFPQLEKVMAKTLGMFKQPFIDSGITPDDATVRTAIFVSALQGVTTQILHRRLHVSRANEKDFVADICKKLFQGLR